MQLKGRYRAQEQAEHWQYPLLLLLTQQMLMWRLLIITAIPSHLQIVTWLFIKKQRQVNASRFQTRYLLTLLSSR
ncbi:hypothetical protein H206_05640 [Candidatus Electrothrix aarhusensis]|uniref:Uncharacterized protein n=1 Tax=Candidatus Electrothrix aarhusensis TaxID=1859131 RepID=A0A3S3RA13_9BACT|nr:hypothetical protein H206_05640 [Candidatus Electrothrix aarhusensis]